jgi:hypothetical protein
MALHYRLRPLNESEAAAISAKKPDEALQRFVMLEMTSSFRFRNVASAEEAVTIGYAIAMRHGQGPRQITKASYVRIGQEEFQDAAIAEAIASSASADELRYEWVRRIAAGQTLPVFIVARCVKELSDNEVWGSFFPTMEGANLSLTVLSGMRFGVRPVTNAAMREQVGEPSEVSKSWVLTGPLLRHNSLVFWWRTPEDDGEEESSPAVEYSAPEAAKSSLAERRRWYHRLLDISRGWD